MFLSRVLLNDSKRETMRALASPQVMHGAVESCYLRLHQDEKGSERKRVLWRIDLLANRCYLLLLSEEALDFTHITEQFGYPGKHHQAETKSYSGLLGRLCEGQKWQFRLRANPVRSSSKEQNERTGRGKVFAHVTQVQQKQWLLERADSCGFSLEGEAFEIMHSEWEKFHKATRGRHEVTLRTATFEGILTIRNVERFKSTLTRGIGRAKAYGCGLLTIMQSEVERV